MILKRTVVLGMCIAMSGGTAFARAQWRPTIDTYGSSRAQFVTRDEAECRNLANQAAGSTGGSAARGAVGGGLIGAAGGAAIGAATGRAGRGAAIGAAAGGIGGGAVRGSQSNAEFERVFRQCMRNRGHNVL
jgi:uncharacterized protein YcfJ